VLEIRFLRAICSRGKVLRLKRIAPAPLNGAGAIKLRRKKSTRGVDALRGYDRHPCLPWLRADLSW